VSVSPAQRALLTQGVKNEAKRLGFDVVGVARADVPLDEDMSRYEAFLDAGYQGSMRYLETDREVRRRLDGPGMLAGARSVVCLARSYKRRDDDEDPKLARSIARYARGQDYHNGLRKKLRRLAAYVRTLEVGAEARPMIDDAPVLERAWAARAGLGFVGKNGMLIVPGQGSYVLLGEVVTTVELEADEPVPMRCGACTRCLDACPTRAFPKPFVLDARRCIAYLTIEAEHVAPVELRDAMGEHVFGCDVCQEVCPFNAGRAEGADTRAFRPHARLDAEDARAWLSLDDAAFDALREGSPLGRPGKEGLRRNAALALGNGGDPSVRPLLDACMQDTQAAADTREAAAWALGKLR
jgi:epoxyqueuosine reductase